MQFDVGIIMPYDTGYCLQDIQSRRWHVISLFASAYGIRIGYFSAASIRVDGNTAYGKATYWDGSKYAIAEARLPEILDNMCPVKEEKLPGISAEALEYLLQRGVINGPVGAGKLRLPDILMAYGFADYAIPTRRVEGFEEITQTVRLWHRCILKPTNGRKGMGVLDLRQMPEGIVYQSTSGSGQFTLEYWAAFQEQWQQFDSFLMQPRLDFHTADGKALDFRLLVSRGGGGQWETVAIYPRVGASSVVSNVSRGGYIGDAEEALEEEFGTDAKRLKEELEYLSREVPQLLQRYAHGRASCYGLDVGIDRESRQPYLIEVNTFPGVKYHAAQLAEKRVLYIIYTCWGAIHRQKRLRNKSTSRVKSKKRIFESHKTWPAPPAQGECVKQIPFKCRRRFL